MPRDALPTPPVPVAASLTLLHRARHGGRLTMRPTALLARRAARVPPPPSPLHASRPLPRCTIATPLTASVVVTVVDATDGALLPETLGALQALDYPDLEIIVVAGETNAAACDLVRRLAEHDPRLRLYSRPAGSVSTARNDAARFATGTIVAFAAADCLVHPHWLHAIGHEFADPAVAVVYGRLLPYSHPIRARRKPDDAGYVSSLDRARYSGAQPAWSMGHAANMAARRADLHAIGGFDPLLGAGGACGDGEGTDLAYRLLGAGHIVAYSPAALVYQATEPSWRRLRTTERRLGLGIGASCGKYLRQRDPRALGLLMAWWWERGVRRAVRAIMHRDARGVYLGLGQTVYPWLGLWRSLRYRLGRDRQTYRQPDDTGRTRTGT